MYKERAPARYRLFAVLSRGNIMEYAIVEKKNRLAVHGIFDSRERAEAFTRETIPVYVARGYYMDKTLRADSFEVIPYAPKRRKRS